jgi:predicted PurR-regulated permease PerM
VLAGFAATVLVVVNTAGSVAESAGEYQARLNELVAQAYALVGADNPPPLGRLFQMVGPGQILGQMASALQGVLSNTLFVLIYVAFLFAAQASFSKRMRGVFPSEEDRERARAVAESIRASIQTYLWVQTALALAAGVLTYVTLLALGLDNPLFWAFVIALMSYVPTIGPIVSTVLPVMFALVQFEELWRVGAVLAGISVWQFLLGNFAQPRLQGQSMNLSALVVLLSLALWGSIWGLVGMFLSAPLTVMAMIILAQFPSTRWLAVLLSAEGKPEQGMARPMRPGM